MTDGTPKLRPGFRLDLVDFGAIFSGLYQVVSTRQVYTREYGLRTHFEAVRASLRG